MSLVYALSGPPPPPPLFLASFWKFRIRLELLSLDPWRCPIPLAPSTFGCFLKSTYGPSPQMAFAILSPLVRAFCVHLFLNPQKWGFSPFAFRFLPFLNSITPPLADNFPDSPLFLKPPIRIFSFYLSFGVFRCLFPPPSRF